jgi:DNA-binding XRE family transcriptional regulator
MLATLTLFCQPAERLNEAKSTPNYPVKEYDAFIITEDSVESDRQIGKLGWDTYGSYIALRRVLIEVPDGVHYGHCNCSGYRNTTPAFYGDYDAHDGNICMVPVTVGTPSSLREHGENLESAFQSAIDSGIFFSIPNEGGGRRMERAHIYKVGEVMDKAHGDKWPKGKISVADIREAAGLTQQQLADATGIPVQTLQQIETGKITAYEAGENYREKIAEALNFCDYRSIF